METNFAEHISGYPKKQSDFLVAMLDTGIISESAKRANITEATAHKWLQGGLNKDLKNIRANIIEKHLHKLQLACGLAVDTFIEVIKDKQNTTSLKLKASKTILDATLKLREQELIITRIEELEGRIKDNEQLF